MLDALAAFVRASLYAALLSGVGAVFADATLRNLGATLAGAVHAATVPIMRRGAIALIVASLLGVVVLIVRLGGQFDETLAAVFSSGTGAALFMQIAGATLLLTSGNEPFARGTRLASASLAVLSLAFNGHAATVGPFEGLFVFVHASAAAWWIGSLFVLRNACTKLNTHEIEGLLSRFSVLATQMIGGLVIAGLLLIYVLVDFETLPSLSPYEQNLAIKLALVGLVLGLATYNKFRLTPRLIAGDTAAKASLKKMIELELIVIAAVLIATAILTTYTSPHE
jgi:putative copper export protein